MQYKAISIFLNYKKIYANCKHANILIHCIKKTISSNFNIDISLIDIHSNFNKRVKLSLFKKFMHKYF